MPRNLCSWLCAWWNRPALAQPYEPPKSVWWPWAWGTGAGSAATRWSARPQPTQKNGWGPRRSVGPGPSSSQPRRTAGLVTRVACRRAPGMLPSRGDGAGSLGCGVTSTGPPGSARTLNAPQCEAEGRALELIKAAYRCGGRKPLEYRCGFPALPVGPPLRQATAGARGRFIRRRWARRRRLALGAGSLISLTSGVGELGPYAEQPHRPPVGELVQRGERGLPDHGLVAGRLGERVAVSAGEERRVPDLDHDAYRRPLLRLDIAGHLRGQPQHLLAHQPPVLHVPLECALPTPRPPPLPPRRD